MIKKSTSVIALGLAAGLTACTSMPTTKAMSPLPQNNNVRVSRVDPDSACKFLSKVEGRTQSVKGTRDEALGDLKQEAANKGANYLVVKQYSDAGTAVTGEAYLCP